MMKRKVMLLICISLALFLCACGNRVEETPGNVTEQIGEEEKGTTVEEAIEETEEMISTEETFIKDEMPSVTEPPATEPSATEPSDYGTILPDIEL